MSNKKVFETIGIDVSKVKPELLEEVINEVERKLVKRLSKLLGSRDEFNVILNIHVNDAINVVTEVEIYSPNPIDPLLEAEIDRLIDKALEEVRDGIKSRIEEEGRST